MKKRETSFGTLEILLERNNEVVSELLNFRKNGYGHTHKKWEIVVVTKGSGTVFYGNQTPQKVWLQTGDSLHIPPNTNHWMEPDTVFEIIITYANKLT